LQRQKTEKRKVMFSHIMVGADDLEASKKFYDAVLGTLGVSEGQADTRGRVFWVAPTGIFAISKPIDGQPASCGNGATIGFAVSGAEQANAWHAAGVANGGTTCEDAPGIRESEMGTLYLAYLRDPAGNKLCALNRMAS
jgi:catechol 2,3-dioxygenase-like lactoylglutathione lyase family enzyme